MPSLPIDDENLPLFTVGQVSVMLEVQQAFLRRLDQKGVVSPSRSEGKQRRYSRREITVVQYVVQLADQGVSLAGIRRILQLEAQVRELEQEMLGAANNLEFEKAALLRDQIRELKRTLDPGKPGVEAGARGSRSVSYSKTRRGARPKVAPSTDLQSQRD